MIAALYSRAQPSEHKFTEQEYVEKYKDDAVKEMLMHGVPASITLSQGMLESGNGNSALAVYANNHFGIKCHDWKGLTFIQDDDTKDECFRKYGSVLESYSDHSQFLKSRPRYAFLFDLKTTDYKGWATGLKQAGYATDPNYAYKLIDIIEKHKLYELDKMVKMPIVKPQEKNIDQPIVKNSTHQILLNNRTKYVIAKEGDTYFAIAKELDMGLWQLYKYNESGKSATTKAGDIVYLQPKKRSADNADTHIVKKNETLYAISQQYGIKLKHLYKKNKLNPGSEIKTGDVIFLRKKKK